MKLVFALVFIGVAVASFHSSDSGNRNEWFENNKQYIWQYDGQLTTGLPITQSQQVAQRIQTRIKLQIRDNLAYVQLIAPTFYWSDRTFAQSSKIDNVESFQPLDVERKQIEQLELPLRLRWEKGVVSDLEFMHEEPVWSQNIKRAIVNMVQVNMNNSGKMSGYDEGENTEENKTFFTIEETTIEGICEVSYTKVIQENEIIVTKSINYDKCSKRAGIRYNMRNGDKCSDCTDPTVSSTIMRFRLTGSEKRFLIREVDLNSKYVFSPFTADQELMSTEVVNKLKLIESGDIENNIREFSGKKTTLLYNLDVQKARELWEMTGEEKYLQKLEYPKTNVVEIVKKLLDDISNMFTEKNGVEIENTHMFSRFVELLRFTTKKELTHLERYVSNKDNEVYKQMFIDALSVSGTKTTVSFLVNQIVDGKISTTKAAQLMKNFVNVRVPSEKVVEDLLTLIKDSVCYNDPVLAQSTKLTIGSLMHKLCGETDDLYTVSKNQNCPRELKEKYVKILRALWVSSESRYEKVLALKVLANAGLDLSIVDLEKVIYDKKEDKTVRMQAIDSLRQLRTFMPRKIQNILMPLYKSRSEIPEIRMTALYHIVHSLPERFVLDQIVDHINIERNAQVAAFTYRLLKSFVNSDNPCEKKFSERVEVALRFLKNKNFETSSRYFHLPLYTNEFMVGTSFDFATIFTNDSILPKEIMSSLDTLIGGKWSKQMVQFVFQQQNLDKVVLKALEKLEKTKNIDEIVLRGKRSAFYRPIDMLRGLVEKISITARHHLDSSVEAHAMLYVRYKNLDYAVIPMNEEIIYDLLKNVIRQGKIDISEFEQTLSKGVLFDTKISTFLYEMSQEVATTFGVPLYLSSKMPVVASVEGQIVAELEPKHENSIKGVKLSLAMKPTAAATNIYHTKIATPFVHTGMKLHHSIQINLPTDVKVDMDWTKKFVSHITFKLPATEKRILKIQSRPVLFVRDFTEIKGNKYGEPEEKVIVIEKFAKMNREIQTSFGKSLLGYNIGISGQAYQKLFNLNKLSCLTTENWIEVRAIPTSGAAREIKWTVEADLFQKDQNIEVEQFDQFYSTLKKNFDTEKLDDFDASETDRRTTFKQNLRNVDFKSATKHRIFVKVQTIGADSDKMAKVELGITCDNKYRFCKLFSDVECSPIGEEHRQWKMKTKVQTLFPETPTSIKNLFEQHHREFVSVVETQWGSKEENTVTLKVQGEQNREMKKWIKFEKNVVNSVENYDYLKEAAQLNQYKVQADYHLEKYYQIKIGKLLQLFKIWNVWNTQIEFGENKENHVFAQLSIEPETRRYINLTVETPIERVYISDIQLPYRLPLLNIVGPHKLNKIISSIGAECQIRSNQIRTFDNLLYKTPLTTCYSVVAKDCSEKPTFAVLVKKRSRNGEEKKVKIIDEQNVFEIEKFAEETKITINKKTVSEEQFEEYGISILADNTYEIKLEQAVIGFDGYNVNVELSHLLQNKQCGLCGHFDGQKDNEFRRADNENTEDIEDFHRTYLVRDEECDIEESKLSEKKNYKIVEEFNEEEDFMTLNKYGKNEIGTDYKKPQLRTRVTEFAHRVCFSKQPIPECLEGNKDKVEEMKVRFTCFNRSTQEAHKYIKLVRREVLSFADLPDSFVETLTVPRTCSVF